MSRSKGDIRKFAAECGLGVDEVAHKLAAAGIAVSQVDGAIPKSKAALARRLLGLGRPKAATKRAAKSVRVARRRERAEARRASERQGVSRSAVTEIGPSTPVIGASAGVTEQEQAQPRVRKPRLRKPDVPGFRWVNVGPEEDDIEFVAADEIEAIHWAIVEDFARDRDPIEPPGVKSHQLLGSASFRPQTTLRGTRKYPTVALAGAALFHAIVHNHPFHNGNKRTALVTLISFFDRNGWVLVVEEDQLFDYVLRLARHEVVPDLDVQDPEAADREMIAVARWLQQHIRRVQKGEFNIQFRSLRKILSEFGCRFEKRPGNRMDIIRGSLKTQVFYSNDGMDVEQNTVHKIRRDLELDDEHNYDSEIFYRTQSKIPGFIAKYRKILERLAEYDRQEALGADQVSIQPSRFR